VEKLRDIKAGRKAEIPIYSFEKHNREPGTTTIYSCHVLVLEGIFALQDPRVLELLDMKIFVETDKDVCLARRLARDVKHRGRDMEGAMKQWTGFVKPNFEKFVEPQKKNADVLIPRGLDNTVAINMVIRHIKRALLTKSRKHVSELDLLGKSIADEPMSKNIICLPDAPQLKAILTIIHNNDTSREDFIFYFDRLSAFLIETAMNELPCTPKSITTAYDLPYSGLTPAASVSAVVVLRSGGTLETGLRRVVPDVRVGRILIQSNFRTGEPELHYQKLVPESALKSDYVLLLDPQMVSGASALMAVRVLVDYGVDEERIIFVSVLASRVGLGRLSRAFPKVKAVVASVGTGGEWGGRWIDGRYFGC